MTVNELVTDLSDQKLPLPYIDIIDNETFGSAANVVDNRYFIGINAATFIILRQLFDRMCASKNILTLFGDADREAETVKMFNPSVFNLTQILNQVKPGEPWPQPVTESR